MGHLLDKRPPHEAPNGDVVIDHVDDDHPTKLTESMLDVLFEDNHCLVVNKPAGLLSQGDITGEAEPGRPRPRLSQRVKYAKPGNVYVGLVHRLDRPTSGVVLLAKTSKAASRLSEQFRRGEVAKTYLAIAEGTWAQGLRRVGGLAPQGRTGPTW